MEQIVGFSLQITISNGHFIYLKSYETGTSFGKRSLMRNLRARTTTKTSCWMLHISFIVKVDKSMC